ncbi:hypothetical protein OG373_35025 [Streptomyces avidinii]|uniref:hypothetical protein n=1 Tax=Streptomyces avidinii TaxID=1895 RepID=UPI003870C986|nr:hypothetical protein OG373_35025 [Streptomyces avidinii]
MALPSRPPHRRDCRRLVMTTLAARAPHRAAWPAAILFALLTTPIAARLGTPHAWEQTVHRWAVDLRSPAVATVFRAITYALTRLMAADAPIRASRVQPAHPQTRTSTRGTGEHRPLTPLDGR